MVFVGLITAGALLVGTASAGANAPVVFGKVTAASNGLLVRLKTPVAGTLTVSGAGLKTTVVSIGPGANKLVVPYSQSSAAMTKSHHKTHVLESFRYGEVTGTSTFIVRL
jgi:hypothetical protein